MVDGKPRIVRVDNEPYGSNGQPVYRRLSVKEKARVAFENVRGRVLSGVRKPERVVQGARKAWDSAPRPRFSGSSYARQQAIRPSRRVGPQSEAGSDNMPQFWGVTEDWRQASSARLFGDYGPTVSPIERFRSEGLPRHFDSKSPRKRRGVFDGGLPRLFG